jgi:phosphatidylglycerophosphate synthase
MSDAYPSGERRPISSRDWRFSGLAARWLASRGVSPNAISVAGMVAGLAAGGCFALTIHIPHLERLFWFIGAVCVQARLLANMLDGMVALESKRSSPIGELYNEIPDRISDAAALIGLGMASNLSLGFSAALAAVFTAYVRAVGKGAGAHQEFCGPLAKPQRMFLVTVLALVCAFAPRSWRIVSGVSLVNLVLAVIVAGSLLTAGRRLGRIVQALRGRSS